VHRDLKLENILFSQEEQLHVKIVDFGSAITLDQYNPKTTNRIITSYYVAPEVATKDENISKCDVWSSGVILFILLSGSLPFKGDNDNVVIERVCKGLFNFDDPNWKNVGSKGKFLIRDMLDINIKNRISFVQCIESPWIKMLTKIDSSFRIDARRLSKAFDRMNEFKPLCKLRVLILHFSLGYFNFDSHIEKISKVYSYIDIRHCACITEKDLYKVARRIFKDVEPAELQ
jgi:calcium-dependent protein kinase